MIKQFKWSEISVLKFEKIKNELEKLTSEKSDDMEIADAYIRIISLIYDISLKDVKKMTLIRFQEYKDAVNKLIHSEIRNNLFENKPASGLIEIRIVDKYYYANYDLKNIPISQFIDIHEIIKNNNKDISFILAHILIPKKGKYNSNYSISELQSKIAKSIDIETAYSLCFFLKQNAEKYMRFIRIYLEAIRLNNLESI